MTPPVPNPTHKRHARAERSGSDAGLVDACLRGDRGAWTTLIRRHSGLIFHTIYRHIGPRPGDDSGLADDLYHRIFLALFERDHRRLRQWRGACSLATWIALVAGSVTVDALRRERRLVLMAPAELHERLGDGDRAASEPEAFDRLARAETARDLRRALAELSHSDRALLEQLVFQGRPARDVATRLGISVGALYTRKTRALARLRRALTPQPPEAA